MRLGLVLVVLMLASSAPAASREVKQYLNSAAALFENLEYEKALKQVEKAKTKASGAEDELLISLYEGVILAEQGKTEKALAAFKAGLSMDPDAKLPLEVSPKVEKAFEGVRASVKKTLAPQLEQQKADEQRRLAEEERQRQARAQAEADAKAKAQRPPTPPPFVPVEVKQPAKSTLRDAAWVPAVGGVALAGTGAFFLVQAKANYDSLENNTVTPDKALRAKEDGKTQQVVGFALAGIGVAALASAGAMWAFGGPEVAPVVSLGPTGAYVGVCFVVP
jgi:tetratricopeptide (TPR) repeat protein